ncbi:integral membrane protein, putative (macronuclear) [Tetrahymena thermophila SB210]|uniref:Nuclear envelope membrane protein n=1 Tax=Tetrahymena thermophila (strain SB210) TaxID=312017 RepID=Q22N97_TETTS|nr:integral membrane protein, putative [Tetrahymena thermophila SB210]EAR86888.1 integral membrane protein, putative [Tetrahymena thermophila SB210]|eukprot:XP_001007133.1 integral membrane protein, putative [Tetrahymena thermophila SB210]
MRKQLENQGNTIKVKVNFLGKVMCATLTIWSNLTFLLFALFFINFQRDIPLYLNINLHVNGLFNLCDAVGLACDRYELKSIAISCLFNIFLILTFWIQHVLMAKLSFKLRVSQIFPEYLIIERPMYNLASQFIYIVSFSLWQPTDLVLYNFSQENIIIDIIAFVGVLIFLKSVYDLNEVADLTGFIFMKRVFSSKEIQFNQKYLPQDNSDAIKVSRIYRMCRHPMQFGTCLIILFGGKFWSISRIIYTLGLIAGINIGISYEESKLENLYDSYKKYKEEIPFRLIPNIFNLFKNSNSNTDQTEKFTNLKQEKAD